MSQAANLSQIPAEAEPLDQSLCGSVHYGPSHEKYISDMENHTCELAKDGAGLSNINQFSKEPPCDADCESMLYETSGNIPIDNGNLQSELVKSFALESELNHSEQRKECLSPAERAAAEQVFEHGHDGFHGTKNEAVGDSKMSGNIVPGQLMNNSTTRLSEFNQSGGGIFTSPEQKYLVEEGKVHSEIVKPCIMMSEVSHSEQLEPLPGDNSKSTDSLHQLVLALQSAAAKGCAGKQSGATHVASYEKSGAEIKPSTISGSPNCRSSGRKQKKTPVKKVKREYTLRKQRTTPETKVITEYKLRKQKETPETKVESEYTPKSSTGRRQGRRSSIQEKAASTEPDGNLENASTGRKRGKKKRRETSEFHDEFKRMRVHLRYLLHRIRCEQNLIDAYSCEGWRGQSLEKLRPEKELQRAKSDINRSKLKIRGLFQRLDEICAEGEFPKTLFDSEGLIDSEDIFCAKCGCRDLSPNNDIILCDGACDRGFHQLCLDPPLRTEEIPPGDEGWFCPACDCKFDCVELINDSMGTNLSLSQSWENVFPEAATKTGSTLDDISGLPSDDSDDNDFNPSGSESDDENKEGGESTSDESDFSSASEDLEAIHNNDDPYHGLPSDDPEDDDYDPIFVDAEDQPKQESSSSDFTSASEDLNATIGNGEISSKDESLMSPSKLLQDCDDPVPVSGRRQIEKLDYKKLYDETYGNSSTDSSDNDDWDDAKTQKRMKNGHENTSSHSSEGEEGKDRVTPQRRNGPSNVSSPITTYVISDAAGVLSVVRNTSSTGKPPLSPKVGVSNDLQTPETSSGVKSKNRPPYKRLGEEAVQRLYAYFKENQYPDNSTKEKLAGELGLLPKQVNKWFVNTRWSVNHPTNGSASGVTSTEKFRSRRNATKSSDQKGSTALGDVASNGVDKAAVEASKDMQQNSPVNHPTDGSASGVTSTEKSRSHRNATKSSDQKGNTALGDVASDGVDKAAVEASKDVQQNSPVNHPTDGSAAGVTSTEKSRSRRNAAKSSDQKGNTALGDFASYGVDKAPVEASKGVQQNSPANPRRKRKSDAGETSSKRTLRSSKK